MTTCKYQTSVSEVFVGWNPCPEGIAKRGSDIFVGQDRAKESREARDVGTARGPDLRLLITRPVFFEYGQWMLTKNSNQSGADDLPTIFLLSENYPNPFNPITTISFTLREAIGYELKIYNTLGQEVGVYTGHDGPGKIDIEWNASGLASGVYLYRLTVRDKVESKKMLLLK